MGLFDKFRKKPKLTEDIVHDDPLFLIEIARFISCGNESVIQETNDCISNTDYYLTKHLDSYKEFDIYYIQNSHEIELKNWIVSILERYHYACGLDWKSDKENFLYFFENLEGIKKYHLSVKEEWFDEEGSIPLWCEILDKNWRFQGMCVAAFDIECDDYVLFPCKITNLEEFRESAALNGYKIDYAINI